MDYDLASGIVQNKYGSCAFSIEKDYAHIYNLYIKKIYRRKGHATIILKRVMKVIKKLGYNGKIQIVAIPQERSISRKQLKNFYLKLGLKVFSYYG